ncbi:hypothetical protein L249_7892, partial [Ophiocordyceps polyrhachis-furcata BCC 54312]
AIVQSSRPKRKPLPPGSLFDSDKILFLAKVAPFFKQEEEYGYNTEYFLNYLNSVSSDIIKQRRVDSICLYYSIPRHFLKSCNLCPARRPSISRMRFVDTLTRYNVLVRASRRELIVYSADNLVIYSSAAR